MRYLMREEGCVLYALAFLFWPIGFIAALGENAAGNRRLARGYFIASFCGAVPWILGILGRLAGGNLPGLTNPS
jgi:hypothetical protein